MGAVHRRALRRAGLPPDAGPDAALLKGMWAATGMGSRLRLGLAAWLLPAVAWRACTAWFAAAVPAPQ